MVEEPTLLTPPLPMISFHRRRLKRPAALPGWAQTAGGWLALVGAGLAVATQLVQLLLLIWRALGF